MNVCISAQDPSPRAGMAHDFSLSGHKTFDFAISGPGICTCAATGYAAGLMFIPAIALATVLLCLLQ